LQDVKTGIYRQALEANLTLGEFPIGGKEGFREKREERGEGRPTGMLKMTEVKGAARKSVKATSFTAVEQRPLGGGEGCC